MDFAETQRGRSRHPVGLGLVVLLHVLLGWALVSGLARKVVDVVQAPVEAKIIEDIKPPEPPPPPPPPDKLPPPPQNLPPPPPAYVPPPEVPVTPPPTPAPTIATTPVAPPPAEVKISTAPPVVAAPPAPPAPAAPVRVPPSLNFGNCEKPDYTPAARRDEAQGVVVVAYTMEVDGHISEARVERSSGPSRSHKQLDRATVEAVLACRGKAGLVDGHPERLTGRVEYVWRLDQ